MLMRAFAVTLSMAVLLTLLLPIVQDVSFEPEYFAWSLLFSVPIGLSVFMGGLGYGTVQPPNCVLVSVALWTSLMAPSFILEHQYVHLGLSYSPEAVTIGRWLFVLWSFVFVLSAGRAPQAQARVAPNTIDVLSIVIPIGLALTHLLIRGRFTNYQGIKADGPASFDLVVATIVGKNALMCLPGFALYTALMAQSERLRFIARVAMLPSIALLVLTGGRSGIAYAVGIAFMFARYSALRLRLRWTVPVLLAVPAFFLLIFTYRTSLLASSNETASLGQLTTIASDATNNLARDDEQRALAMSSLSENLRVRLAMGPQYFAVVEGWLANGAMLEGTFQSGLLTMLPSFLFPGKNAIAADTNFETALLRTGRFPYSDLAPTPWMQWLFELGFLGIILGALFYGGVVRFMERRIVATTSIFQLFGLAYVLSNVLSAESTTDALVLVGRDAVLIALCSKLISLFMHGAIAVRDARAAAAAQRARMPDFKALR